MSPKRVNRAEQSAYKFFYAGLDIRDGILVRPPHRVLRVKRWPNVQWSSEKAIDFTGAMYGGLAFTCEAKMHEMGRDHSRRFQFSSISPRQRSFLNNEQLYGTYPLLWIQFVESTARHSNNDCAFLIPWAKWQEMEITFKRQCKNGKEHDWRSINLEWMIYYFADYQLNYTKGGLWWTEAESKAGYHPLKLEKAA